MAYASAPLDSLAALGDATRRSIFERVARGPAAVGEIAKDLPVSRPAVSQHLRVLEKAGLVTESREGTRHVYRLDPRGIAAMRDWLDAHWSIALQNFQSFADADEADGEPDVPPSSSPGKTEGGPES